VQRSPDFAFGERFICFMRSHTGGINIQSHNRIDVIIIALYAVEVEVEKIDGGDFAAPNGACQLSSGIEMDKTNVISGFD
jgi:hypothetical protein